MNSVAPHKNKNNFLSKLKLSDTNPWGMTHLILTRFIIMWELGIMLTSDEKSGSIVTIILYISFLIKYIFVNFNGGVGRIWRDQVCVYDRDEVSIWRWKFEVEGVRPLGPGTLPNSYSRSVPSQPVSHLFF